VLKQEKEKNMAVAGAISTVPDMTWQDAWKTECNRRIEESGLIDDYEFRASSVPSGQKQN
jgi:hypothetical protein